MTRQIKETLVIDGQVHEFGWIDLPQKHPRIWTSFETILNPIDGSQVGRPRPSISSGRKNNAVDGIFFSTACHRGYLGTWEIREQFLYLNKIEGAEAEMIGDEPIPADWFTGTLSVGRGKVVFDIGDGPVYEKLQVITIEAGRIVSTDLIDNPEATRW